MGVSQKRLTPYTFKKIIMSEGENKQPTFTEIVLAVTGLVLVFSTLVWSVGALLKTLFN